MVRRDLTRCLSPAEIVGVRSFLAGVRALLGEDLVEARLFGSRARGEGRDDSDVDIALIVTPRGRVQRYAVYDIAFDLGLTHGVPLAPLVLAEDTVEALRRRERRLAADLDRDGIPL
jgi:predicted nucleotidyltransferase